MYVFIFYSKTGHINVSDNGKKMVFYTHTQDGVICLTFMNVLLEEVVWLLRIGWGQMATQLVKEK